MILAFSTSSPWSSVALVSNGGDVRWSASRHAPQQASGACLTMLQEMKDEAGVHLDQVTMFTADLGPGSFTGVRVGVMLAKTFAWMHGKPVAGVDAFDLIAPDRTVCIPSKRGELFIREVGQAPYRVSAQERPVAVGYGDQRDIVTFPDAARIGALIDRLTSSDPVAFAPRYLMEPSISIPKRIYTHD